MERGDFFLETIAELKYRTRWDASPYDAVMTTGLLRKLLLEDRNPERNLTDALGSGDGPYRITGSWVDGRPVNSSILVNEHPDGHRFWGNRFSYAGVLEQARKFGMSDMRPPLAELTRAQFRDLVVVEAGPRSWTVENVIHYAGYVVGGVHAGKAGSDDQKELEQLDKEPTLGNWSLMQQTLIGIGQTTVDAMRPVVERLERRKDPHRPEG